MRNFYDICIFGASAFAVGFAEAHPGLEIVILEDGLTPGREFSAALRKASVPEGIKSPLLDELEERGAIGDDIWEPAVTPVLAERLLKLKNTDTYFFAVSDNIESTGGVYKVSFSAYGIGHSFTAKKILYTSKSAAGLLECNSEVTVKLNYLVLREEQPPELRSISCPEGISKAREDVITSEKDKVLLFASETDAIFCNPGMGIFRPSAYYSDPISAFDAGAKLDYDEIPTPEIKSREPIDDGEFDVIVAGLGTAGSIASIVAAESGLRVLGLENLSMQGGSGTAGGVLSYYYGFKGGVYRTIDEEAEKLNSEFAPSVGIGAAQKAVTLDRTSDSRKVDRRFGAFVIGALTEKSGGIIKVCGVKYVLDGITHIAHAKFVIDCTADAVVCTSAGLKMQGGRPFDGEFQPYSSVYLRTDYKRIFPGYIDNGRVNQYDPDDFSKAVLSSASSYVHLYRNYSSRKYLGIMPLIGLREGLRPIGEENVRFIDLINGKFTLEPVCFGRSNIDNHGKDSVFEDRNYQDFITVSGLWEYIVGIPLPVGALIPKDSDGILTAGRSVAVDHDIAMGMRMKDDCQKSGEAAARLAVISIKYGIRAVEVNRNELRAQLALSGCLGSDDRMLLKSPESEEMHEYPFWCNDEAELEAGLSSDSPGYYIWSARALEKVGISGLLKSENMNARWHSALALSMITTVSPDIDRQIADALLECALSRDGFVPISRRKYTNLRSVSAISALARFAGERRLTDPEKFVSRLSELLDLSGELSESLPFNSYDLITDREDLRFQYESHIVDALSKISESYPECAAEVSAILERFFEKVSREERKLEVSLMETEWFKLDCTEKLRKLAKLY